MHTKPDIVILGGTGMVGSMVARYFSKYYPSCIVFSHQDFDAVKQPVTEIAAKVRFGTIVINCIETSPQENPSFAEYKARNVDFPHQLAALCERRFAKLIHISTNRVFSGRHDRVTEADQPDSTEIYGLSKGFGEPKNCMVIRCNIIGPEIHSHKGFMDQFLHSEEPVIQGYTDSIWNGADRIYLNIRVYHICRRIF